MNNVWTPFPSYEKKKNKFLTLRGIADVSNLFDWTMHQVKGVKVELCNGLALYVPFSVWTSKLPENSVKIQPYTSRPTLCPKSRI